MLRVEISKNQNKSNLGRKINKSLAFDLDLAQRSYESNPRSISLKSIFKKLGYDFA